MDHVERWLAPRELRAIVMCVESLGDCVYGLDARSKCGRNSLGARNVCGVDEALRVSLGKKTTGGLRWLQLQGEWRRKSK
jgi:hypothetical protein